MYPRQYKRHYLYVLAAIVLLLQSFAVWHDAEHPFHKAEAQCERLNAIGHFPLADVAADVSIYLQQAVISLEVDSLVTTLPFAQRQSYLIRAPPAFS